MKYYAVIDTNVIVAALLTKNKDSAALKAINAVLGGTIIPLCHQDILAEYNEVLHRPKFSLREIKESSQSEIKSVRTNNHLLALLALVLIIINFITILVLK